MAVKITFIIHSLEKFLSASQLLIGNSTSATSSNIFAQEVLLAWQAPGGLWSFDLTGHTHTKCCFSINPAQSGPQIPNQTMRLKLQWLLSRAGRSVSLRSFSLGIKIGSSCSTRSPRRGCCWGQMDGTAKPTF